MTSRLIHAIRKLVIAAGILLAAAPAHAFDAATTHAGLTEQAALASALGRLLAESYGRPLGLYETLTLRLDGARGRRIATRLAKLDQSGGYAPERLPTAKTGADSALVDGGRLPAIGWLIAGSVAEEVPGQGGRNHFYDPVRGRGLDQGGFLDGLGLRIAGVDSGGGARGVFTGASFDGTGRPSIDWLLADDNDFSLARFLDARERATAATAPADRERALAEALLAAGALLHVVEDAADPAHVRNDYRVAMGENGARLERLIAARYGRLGLPPAAGPADPLVHLADAIHTADGGGLADRTARRFFSDGTLPGSDAPYPEPQAQAGPAALGYVAGDGVAHLLAWRRDDHGKVRFAIDERCLTDYAAAILPEAQRSALSALAHLFRGRLRASEGAIHNGDLALAAGRIDLLTEDEKGVRRVVATRDLTGAKPGERLLGLPEGLPAGKLAVLFRGRDGNGEPIVIGTDLPR
ncbi:MAG: hypothetical protein EXR72_09175 [Myxococcales bacterium]|nr:hypothetical protein [Myxococcales bacterium]